MQRHLWDRISQLSKVLSRIKKVLHWNRCLTSQHKWSTMRKKLLVWTKFCMGRILGHICHWLIILWSLVFKAPRSTYSQILCYVSAKFFNILNATKLGRTELQEYEPREATEIMMLSVESRLNSSGIFSQDSQRCSSVTRSAIFWALWDKHQRTCTGRILFMSMFNYISCGSRDNEKECELNARLVSQNARRFGTGQWSFIGPRSEKKWYPISEDSWDYFSHNQFWKSAQSLRSSRWNVWRTRNSSRLNGATRCGRKIEFLIRAKRDQDRSAFGLWWLG